MRNRLSLFFLPLFLILAGIAFAEGVDASPAEDPGRPGLIQKTAKNRPTIYQPQVDSWKNYKELHFRCAISQKGRQTSLSIFQQPEQAMLHTS